MINICDECKKEKEVTEKKMAKKCLNYFKTHRFQECEDYLNNIIEGD